jgi:hypothetical protein
MSIGDKAMVSISQVELTNRIYKHTISYPRPQEKKAVRNVACKLKKGEVQYFLNRSWIYLAEVAISNITPIRGIDLEDSKLSLGLHLPSP